jgi:hypothetical protein
MSMLIFRPLTITLFALQAMRASHLLLSRPLRRLPAANSRPVGPPQSSISPATKMPGRVSNPAYVTPPVVEIALSGRSRPVTRRGLALMRAASVSAQSGSSSRAVRPMATESRRAALRRWFVIVSPLRGFASWRVRSASEISGLRSTEITADLSVLSKLRM